MNAEKEQLSAARAGLEKERAGEGLARALQPRGAATVALAVGGGNETQTGQAQGCSPARFTSPGLEEPHLCLPDPFSLPSFTLCLQQQRRCHGSPLQPAADGHF